VNAVMNLRVLAPPSFCTSVKLHLKSGEARTVFHVPQVNGTSL
jgi:hypothetical protein